jgi:MFS transporter, SP family, sugar:H+ symporter
MFICFMIFASVGHFSLNRDDPHATQSASVALIVFACLFILGFATTWGPMVWTIISEIYPSKYRSRAMSYATASNWIWNFLIAFFTSFITGAIDFRYGYIFAACNVLGGLIVFFFVIEGRNRTLEELDTMYIEKVLPWKSEKWQAPDLDAIRQGALAGWAKGEVGADVERPAAPVEPRSPETSAEQDRDLEKQQQQQAANGGAPETEHAEHS